MHLNPRTKTIKIVLYLITTRSLESIKVFVQCTVIAVVQVKTKSMFWKSIKVSVQNIDSMFQCHRHVVASLFIRLANTNLILTNKMQSIVNSTQFHENNSNLKKFKD